MAHWISFPRSEGESSRQAHTDLPAGSYERELGREGFYGPATQMVHRHPPTAWERVEGPLRPRAFDTTRIDSVATCPWQATPLFGNPHLRIRYWQCSDAMSQLVRNADGDELIFVHAGAAEFFCDYGHLHLREGDFLILPRGTLWRLEPEGQLQCLLIEASADSYRLPDKGILGRHAIFDTAMLDVPGIDADFLAQQGESSWTVRVKRRGELSTIHYPFNPLDAIGWHGDLMPVRINWRDIRPVMSHRYHIPPSAHTLFMSGRFVICCFVPRPLESDPGALRVPFYHNNDDYDELIFYHRGRFFSRDNIHPGMLSLHPSGITHGPHPGAYRRAQAHPGGETDEVAVMIDSRDALEVDQAALDLEWSAYVDSWRDKGDDG